MATRTSVIFGWLAASFIFLSGCTVVIQRFSNDGGVLVALPYFYRAGTFSARLNNLDVTSWFTVDAQNGKASAWLFMLPRPQPDVLEVTACWEIDMIFVLPAPWPLHGCSDARATFGVLPPPRRPPP
jgi:hypothetical protein